MAALRYEWVRIRTVRSTWWLTALSLVTIALIAAFYSANVTGEFGADSMQPMAALEPSPAPDADPGVKSPSDPFPEPDFERPPPGQKEAAGVFGTAVVQFAPLLMALIGALAFGHEYRYGTIRPTLSAVTSRGAVAAAKIVVVTLWAAVVGSAGVGVAWLMVLLVGRNRFPPDLSFFAGPTERMAAGTVGYVVITALIGLGLSWLFRNIPAALVIVLAMPAIELALRAALALPWLERIADWGRYLPFSAGAQMYAYSVAETEGVPEFMRNDLPPLTGAVVFGGFAAVILLLAYVLFRKRDA